MSIRLDNLTCLILLPASVAGRSLLLCRYSSFSTCTMQQLRARKTQPLSEDEGSQRCLFILQSQAGEGFRVPWMIWLWQLAPVAMLLGEGERLWAC